VTPAITAPQSAREAARWLNSYARKYHAGAFATPTAAELEKIRQEGGWHWWAGGVAAVSQKIKRPSYRKDWTGRQYYLDAGWQVISHLAAWPDAELPDLEAFDRIYAYAEDANVTGQLREQGREIAAVKITAAGEIVNCWGRNGSGYTYPAAEAATLAAVTPGPHLDLATAEAEVAALDGFSDPDPYYSDGSWGALTLRGFKPTDPTFGIKPAEMSKAWHREHPAEAALGTCSWTVLADRLPYLTGWLRSVPWWDRLERVRLLRMAGQPSGKVGRLARHTDITDRAAGVRDGLIARFHIPLVTDPRITMTAWNLRGSGYACHLAAGSCWYLDARKPHAVANPTATDRVHLVVDVLSSDAVRFEVESGIEMCP
jgi:hypothetical protein